MSEVPPPSPMPAGNPEDGGLQRFAHAPMSARVPEKVMRGVTATGFLAYFGPTEFVIDFLQLLSRPALLVGRVIMSPLVAEQFLGVLRENLGRYAAQFGQPPAMPKSPPPDRPRSPQEIYDELKIPDELLCGVYANTVMVGHTPAEFGIDFITSFIPHACVSARVYVSAPRVPQLIETLNGLVMQYKRQHGGGGQGGGGGAGVVPPVPPQNYGTAPGVPGFPTPPGQP